MLPKRRRRPGAVLSSSTRRAWRNLLPRGFGALTCRRVCIACRRDTLGRLGSGMGSGMGPSDTTPLSRGRRPLRPLAFSLLGAPGRWGPRAGDAAARPADAALQGLWRRCLRSAIHCRGMGPAERATPGQFAPTGAIVEVVEVPEPVDDRLVTSKLGFNTHRAGATDARPNQSLEGRCWSEDPSDPRCGLWAALNPIEFSRSIIRGLGRSLQAQLRGLQHQVEGQAAKEGIARGVASSFDALCTTLVSSLCRALCFPWLSPLNACPSCHFQGCVTQVRSAPLALRLPLRP